MIKPKEFYEVEIGKETDFNLGKFQGDYLDQVFCGFEIQSTTDDSLNQDFTIHCSYVNEQVGLTIDLRQINPNLAGSSVQGALTIMVHAKEKVEYKIKFNLTSSSSN